MLTSKATSSVTYSDIGYEQALAKLEQIFSIDSGYEIGLSTAERLSPIAAAHRIFTGSMSMLPIQLRQKVNGERREVSLQQLDYILHVRFNEKMSPALGKKIIASQAFWYGLGAAYIERDGYGNVVGLIPLQTAGYQYFKDYSTGQEWYAFNSDGEYRKFQPSELLLCFFESYDGKYGKGLLDLAKETISTDSASQRYLRKFYTNGGRLSGILEIDADANKATRDTVRAEFENYASGMDNTFKVAVLDKGFKYTSLGISQADAQFMESRAFSVAEISRFTGIPEFMLQSGKQSYSSNEQQQINFVMTSLMQHVVQWEQEWAYKLYSEAQLLSGYYMRFNVSALMRGDDASRAKFYQMMIFCGVLCQDECRAMEERNPIPNGNGQHYFITKNLDTIENLVQGGET